MRDKNIIRNLIGLMLIISLISGCNLIMAMRREAKEERNILGYTKGYNPRIREVQQILKEAGFYSAAIDGKMNKETRKAVSNFQKEKKLKITGFLDAQTWLALDKHSFEEIKKKESIASEEIKNKLNSLFWIKKIKRALKNSGFDPGPIDGTMNNETKRAIKDFQRSKGLKADGIIGPKTWEEISKHFPQNQT